MRTEDAINIADLRLMAKRRLPRLVFDYIEGGAEDEHGLRRNERAFERYRLIPRYLTDVSVRTQATELFGRRYSSPFGIAPTGTLGLFRRDADLMLAEAAVSANIPFVMSGANSASLEAAAAAAPDHLWYQLYAAREPRIAEDFVCRARDAGIRHLVVTVDVPVNSKRERNLRNRFSHALRPPLGVAIEALTHPAWLLDYLRHGVPQFSDWTRYAGDSATAKDTAAFFGSQFPHPALSWRDIETYRRLWPHTLVVKGLMHPGDAERAVDVGVDGVIISNHGGRQLDRAPSPLDMIGAIKAAVGDKLVLMLDSGVRRGADIIVALCLGARFVFIGRAAVYGVAAAGVPGARRTIDILREEIDLNLGQMGCTSIQHLAHEALMSEERFGVDVQK